MLYLISPTAIWVKVPLKLGVFTLATTYLDLVKLNSRLLCLPSLDRNGKHWLEPQSWHNTEFF